MLLAGSFENDLGTGSQVRRILNVGFNSSKKNHIKNHRRKIKSARVRKLRESLAKKKAS